MPPVAINVAFILVLILPGFLSYRFAVWRKADPSQRSPLWQLSEILEHSVYVHLIGIALIAAVHFPLQWFSGQSTYAAILFQDRPNAFLRTHFAEAALWFTLYPVYVIISAAILGAYDVPSKVSSLIVRAVKRPAEGISATGKVFAWFPVPKESYPQEPVWYYAFNVMTDGYTSKYPHVYVTLKSGDVYYGELVTYPIALDTEHKKDFLIRNSIYYEGGDANRMRKLYEADNVGAVLLNTTNLDSIIIYYEDISREDPG